MMRALVFLTLFSCLSSLAYGQDLSTPRRPVKKKSTPAPARSERTVKSILFNLGTHTEFFNNVQVDQSGGVRKIDFAAPTIGAGLEIPMNSGWNFVPEINWVLPRTIGKARIIKNLFMYRADFGYDPVDWLRLRVGTSIMWLNQHGRGGSVEVNNGDSTSTFYYPEENRSSLSNTFDVGVEGKWDEWALRLQTYTYFIFREERRQVSYTLLVSYYWDRK